MKNVVIASAAALLISEVASCSLNIDGDSYQINADGTAGNVACKSSFPRRIICMDGKVHLVSSEVCSSKTGSPMARSLHDTTTWIPNSVNGARFKTPSDLSIVVFEPGSQLRTIGDRVFSGCRSLSITIPANVKVF